MEVSSPKYPATLVSTAAPVPALRRPFAEDREMNTSPLSFNNTATIYLSAWISLTCNGCHDLLLPCNLSVVQEVPLFIYVRLWIPDLFPPCNRYHALFPSCYRCPDPFPPCNGCHDLFHAIDGMACFCHTMGTMPYLRPAVVAMNNDRHAIDAITYFRHAVDAMTYFRHAIGAMTYFRRAFSPSRSPPPTPTRASPAAGCSCSSTSSNLHSDELFRNVALAWGVSLLQV